MKIIMKSAKFRGDAFKADRMGFAWADSYMWSVALHMFYRLGWRRTDYIDSYWENYY